MLIGVPRETKNHECRVGLTPASVGHLVSIGHEVWVEENAGTKIGFDDDQYRKCGASIVNDKRAFSGELIVKVKEPSIFECELISSNQILFCYLHLAAEKALTEVLLKRKISAIAYETVLDDQGRLPLLSPMSAVAGRLSVQVGANALLASRGGRGKLLGGVPGVSPGKVVILGGGVAGTNAATIATGMQAEVVVIDKSADRLGELSLIFNQTAKTLMASQDVISHEVQNADLVIGSVLIPGAKTPKLIDRALLRSMVPGSVLVDVAIDQGGTFETSRPTTHDSPTYLEEDIVHYCVTNMSGEVALTSTLALNNVTLPYVELLATAGIKEAFKKVQGFSSGLNTYNGTIVHATIAAEYGA